ncbi:hypothetical protein NW768_008952 [Fusarium equiseti]|uniref:Uncharacterized protein n=1 Tax=Fusarium equiseti TaxID=61235 RepID=A0ABQ8R3P6_FUSEQ|nr:hypothetical protein NW768_008952 [Fusarium equiseti]
MAPRSFLSLPHELRHMIYREYFTLDKGYAYQPGPGRLGTFDGEPLDLSLMYTCRFIACETKDMPLTSNTIYFSTVYHPEWREWAGRFDYLLHFQEEQRFCLLCHISRFVTPEMYSEIRAHFPWFVPLLEGVERRYSSTGGVGYCRRWDYLDTIKAPSHVYTNDPPSHSLLCSATDFTLRLLAHDSNPLLAREVHDLTRSWGSPNSIANLLGEAFNPWDIPERYDLHTAGERLQDNELWSSMSSWQQEEGCDKEYHYKFRFSATSVAIDFLKRLPTDKGQCIRNVVILEDHPAVGQQERHAVGLIPFCKENSQLKIDLRLSMVGNVFQRHFLKSHDWFGDLLECWKHDPCDLMSKHLGKGVYKISSRWLTEALALKDAGMPSGSFTLTLDGGRAVDLCSDVFQQEVFWRASMSKAADRCFPCPPDMIRRDCLFYLINPSSIQAFEHLVNQTSILRSSFHPGIMWNMDQLIADRSGYEPHQWEDDLFNRQRYNAPRSVYVPPMDSVALDNFETRPLSQRPQNRTDRYRNRR